jgi:hypothetical protein
MVTDTNSRGAQLPNNVEGMRKIESYFSPQGEGTAPSASSARQSHLRAHPPATVSGSNDTARDTLSQAPPLQATASNASHHHTERAASVVELRKANENLRIGKEQAEQKVPRPPSCRLSRRP